MTKLRMFDKKDWERYIVIEDSPEKPPLIREGKEWIGICDISGIEVHFCGVDSSLEEDWYLSLPAFRYGLSEFILQNLPDRLQPKLLEELGFVKI